MKRNNIDKCRSLRKNQTDVERRFWGLLKNRQLNKMKFRRQFSVGKYILDFYCPEIGLGIEADGGQHYFDEGGQTDEIRTNELRKLGINIIRFSNRDILTNINGVYELITNIIEKENPLTSVLSPKGRGCNN